MIKNFNDILSLLVLIFALIYALRIFIWSIVDDNDDNNASIFELLKDYNNNTEE